MLSLGSLATLLEKIHQAAFRIKNREVLHLLREAQTALIAAKAENEATKAKLDELKAENTQLKAANTHLVEENAKMAVSLGWKEWKPSPAPFGVPHIEM